MTVASRLAVVRERIAAACARSGRAPEEVTLVAVSKTMTAELIDEALAAGAEHIGENRVQEARDKFPLLTHPARRHLIGTLQSNKAKLAVQLFDVIQTIDSIALAQAVSRYAANEGREIDILVQVNVGEEPQKSGVSPAETGPLVEAVSGLPNLRLRGLMAIPPHDQDEWLLRHHFRVLRGLRETIQRESSDRLPELSMGMTDDFEIAIEEGATIVRVGRAIFGERQK